MKSRHDEGGKPKEPSLKDALLPEKPGDKLRASSSPGKTSSYRPRTDGEKSSLEAALLPEGHRPSPPPAKRERETSAEAPRTERGKDAPAPSRGSRVVGIVVSIAIVAGVAAVILVGRFGPANVAGHPSITATATKSTAGAAGAVTDESSDPAAAGAGEAASGAGEESGAFEGPGTSYDDPGPMSLAEIQEKGLIIDVHEHIESLAQAPKFIAAMDALGIQTMCLMGSSKFTLTLNESFGFTEYDENNEELLKIVEAYPGRFEAWPTINPEDPEKLAKLQDLVARGATGVKLYIGHGYVTRKHTYMFHTVAMDDPEMMPLYAWCEENYIPLMLHVNPFGEKKGFAEEFIAVLSQHPDLKVIAPHFMLSSVYNPRLEELLDTFPNLYSDVSFGDSFMAVRLTYMSKYPEKFRRIFSEYPDRFMFASDLVMIENRPDDWAPTQLQAYINMLASEKYTSPAITEPVPGLPGVRREQKALELTGLNLSDDLVSRILFRNYHAFRASRPKGTEITHEIDWERMNQEEVEREAGQAFPPKPKGQ